MTTIKLRRDTSTNWTSVNPTLAEGEVGIETNTNKLKIGDGSTTWTSLDYATYTPDEIDALLLKKQDLLTAGSGINIQLVYPDQVTNSYAYVDSSHTTWTNLTELEAQNFNIYTHRGRAISSVNGTRDFQMTCELPLAANTRYIGFSFNSSLRNSYQLPYAGMFAVHRTSATGTTIGFYTSKSNSAFSWNERGTVDNVPLSATSVYIKLVKSDTKFYWYYKLNENDNWTNVTGNETDYITGTTSTSSIGSNAYFPLTSSDIPLYFGVAGSGSGSQDIIIDLTKTTFVYTPISDPQLTISTDATVQETLVSGTNIKTINSTDLLSSGNIDLADTTLSNVSSTSNTCFDGQWVALSTTLVSGVTAPTTDALSYDLSEYLPDDSYNYEVLIGVSAATGSTSGDQIQIAVYSTILTSSVFVCAIQTRTSSGINGAGSIIFPIGSDRTIYIQAKQNNTGKFNLYLRGYRRIGTNS